MKACGSVTTHLQDYQVESPMAVIPTTESISQGGGGSYPKFSHSLNGSEADIESVDQAGVPHLCRQPF